MNYTWAAIVYTTIYEWGVAWRVAVTQVKEGARGTEWDYLDDLDDRAEVEQVRNLSIG